MTPKVQAILEKNSADRARLLAAVEALTDAQMAYQPGEGQWSVADVLHHLALADEATGKLMSLFLRRARDENVPEDPTPDASMMDAINGVVPGVEEGKAKAPDIVTPRSSLAPSEALSRLDASRKRMNDVVDTLSVYDGTKLTFKHGFFGELHVYQWLLVSGWHEHRHTKQIERIQSSADFPSS